MISAELILALLLGIGLGVAVACWRLSAAKYINARLGQLDHHLTQAAIQMDTFAGQLRLTVANQQAAAAAALQQQLQSQTSTTLQELASMRHTLKTTIQQLNGTVGDQLGAHNKVVMEVRGQLGGLFEAARAMQQLGHDIGTLQDILRAPKLRGSLGELLLEDMLRQVLPTAAFATQFRLSTSQSTDYVIVDAVIFLGDKMVPIDSKFPLEAYSRLLTGANLSQEEQLRRRKAFLQGVIHHMQTVASKYIRPENGTYDFALVYFPAESIYYEAIVRDAKEDEGTSIAQVAAKYKVVPVSPNTLYAYLLTVAYGLKGLQIERQAENMRRQMHVFQRKLEQFGESFAKVGKTLTQAKNCYDDTNKRYGQLQDCAADINASTTDDSPLLVDKDNKDLTATLANHG